MPYGSLRIVNEKQQSMKPCSFAGRSDSSPGLLDVLSERAFAGVVEPEVESPGL